MAALQGRGASLRRVEIAAATVSARHSHAHEQFLVVTAGRGVLRCDAGEVALVPGTIVRFAPGAWHSAEFAEATVLIEVNLAE
jgi:quercetin dioxygenase-like cupin family protein